MIIIMLMYDKMFWNGKFISISIIYIIKKNGNIFFKSRNWILKNLHTKYRP